MNFSILIPHYKVGKMTAYAIAQLLKFKGKHEVEIIVIDNSHGWGVEYLIPFFANAKFIEYPEGKTQSHGVAFDYAIEQGLVTNEYFITIESDAFPTNDTWLDYYEDLILQGYDAAGSLLKLSGGEYLHPCGALYSKSLWNEVKEYVDTIPYNYYPNFMMRDNFPVHTMIHKSLVEELSKNPDDWIELSSGYKDNTEQTMAERLKYYSPIGKGVFHNGMGGRQESVNTYGLRTIESEAPFAIINGTNKKIIGRLGLEPGQFISYYMAAKNKKVFYVPTKVVWLPNRENQQQEYTLMENGLHHCWGVSSYVERNGDDVQDIIKAKRGIPDMLYETLPEHQKMQL